MLINPIPTLSLKINLTLILNVTLLAITITVTKNSSGDEIANVNFFTTTPSTTFMQCTPEATEFTEIMQNKGHYAVQGHSKSLILLSIESSYMTSY